MSMQTFDLEWALAALYLRGAPRPWQVHERAWQTVSDLLRRECSSLSQAPSLLRKTGYRLEASILENSATLDWCQQKLLSGQVLTAASLGYPSNWLGALGNKAPAALWQGGELREGGQKSVAVVGSRQISRKDQRFAFEVGFKVAQLGYSFVSGGARGSDTWAARGACQALSGMSHVLPKVVEILPYGLLRAEGEPRGSWLSVCEPEAGFSSAQAMERNRLIYAMADYSVVVRAHFKQGGTWRGCTDALRRGLTSLIVQEDKGDLAMRALAGLGGVPISRASDLENAIQAIQNKPDLWSCAKTFCMETRQLYLIRARPVLSVGELSSFA